VGGVGIVSTGKPETLSLKVKRKIEEQKEDKEGYRLYKTPFHGSRPTLSIPRRRQSFGHISFSIFP
jgi:hypothetical protein